MNTSTFGSGINDLVLRKCLEGIRAHTTGALAQLYDLTSVRVYALAMGILGDTAAADRVVEDLYAEVWRGERIDTKAVEGFCGRLLLLCRDLALAVLHADDGDPARDVDVMRALASASRRRGVPP